MTRTTEQGARERLQYTNDNPDPRFRPVVSAVMQKLREMKVFDDGRAAAFIIADLVYSHLVRKPHPDHLFYLLQQIHSYWGRMLLDPDPSPEIWEARKLEEAQNAVTRADPPEKTSLPMDITISVRPDGVFTRVEEPKPVKPVSTPAVAPEIDLDSTPLKDHIDKLIADHIPNMLMASEWHCSCGKEFDSQWAWARHVRIRVWRVLSGRSTQSGQSGSNPNAPASD